MSPLSAEVVLPLPTSRSTIMLARIALLLIIITLIMTSLPRLLELASGSDAHFPRVNVSFFRKVYEASTVAHASVHDSALTFARSARIAVVNLVSICGRFVEDFGCIRGRLADDIVRLGRRCFESAGRLDGAVGGYSHGVIDGLKETPRLMIRGCIGICDAYLRFRQPIADRVDGFIEAHFEAQMEAHTSTDWAFMRSRHIGSPLSLVHILEGIRCWGCLLTLMFMAIDEADKFVTKKVRFLQREARLAADRILGKKQEEKIETISGILFLTVWIVGALLGIIFRIIPSLYRLVFILFDIIQWTPSLSFVGGVGWIAYENFRHPEEKSLSAVQAATKVVPDDKPRKPPASNTATPPQAQKNSPLKGILKKKPPTITQLTPLSAMMLGTKEIPLNHKVLTATPPTTAPSTKITATLPTTTPSTKIPAILPTAAPSTNTSAPKPLPPKKIPPPPANVINPKFPAEGSPFNPNTLTNSLNFRSKYNKQTSYTPFHRPDPKVFPKPLHYYEDSKWESMMPFKKELKKGEGNGLAFENNPFFAYEKRDLAMEEQGKTEEMRKDEKEAYTRAKIEQDFRLKTRAAIHLFMGPIA